MDTVLDADLKEVRRRPHMTTCPVVVTRFRCILQAYGWREGRSRLPPGYKQRRKVSLRRDVAYTAFEDLSADLRQLILESDRIGGWMQARAPVWIVAVAAVPAFPARLCACCSTAHPASVCTDASTASSASLPSKWRR
jgi:hypothetical protein